MPNNNFTPAHIIYVRHSKDIECYNFSSCISKGISYAMIFTSRHIRSPALSKAPIGLSRQTGTAHTGITLYRTIRFKERIQCIGPSEFTGPRESVNVIPNWEECITGIYWPFYTHRVALGDAAHDAGTKLLPRKCRISTMPVSIGGSENPGNRICAIFLPPQYSC